MAQAYSSRANPRIQAALCYAFPLLPAVALLRERNNGFVRLHAAQAIAFFSLLALAQVIVFSALVGAGAFVTNLALATLLGIVFYGLFAIVGLLGLIFWLDLLFDALSGRFQPYYGLTALAKRIEHVAARMQSFHVGRGALE